MMNMEKIELEGIRRRLSIFAVSTRRQIQCGRRQATGEDRAGYFVAWQSTQRLFPTTLLVLIPKYPFCAMAYVALFMCAGISATTARSIRIVMLVLCIRAFFARRIRGTDGMLSMDFSGTYR
jgi:hypothetical protein